MYNRHFPKPLPIAQFEVGITEAPAWNGLTRVIVLTDHEGVRQWRCEGLAENVTPECLRLLADLLEQAEARQVRQDASASSAPHLVPSGVEGVA